MRQRHDTVQLLEPVEDDVCRRPPRALRPRGAAAKPPRIRSLPWRKNSRSTAVPIEGRDSVAGRFEPWGGGVRSSAPGVTVVSRAMETLSPPYLLLATPTLLDPNFAQSVVLMAHHDTEGAMGWIVNRLHEQPVRELLDPGQLRGVHPGRPCTSGGRSLPTRSWPSSTGRSTAWRAWRSHRACSCRARPTSCRCSSRGRPARARSRPAGVRIRRLGRGPARRRDGGGAWLPLPYDEDLAFSPRVEDLWRRSFERFGLDPARLGSGSGRKH